jgi:hypothetical protein
MASRLRPNSVVQARPCEVDHRANRPRRPREVAVYTPECASAMAHPKLIVRTTSQSGIRGVPARLRALGAEAERAVG